MSTQVKPTKPTYRDIEIALIAVVKAGLYYRRPKDGVTPGLTRFT